MMRGFLRGAVVVILWCGGLIAIMAQVSAMV